MRRSLIITDHAVVRYLERVGGFEVERLKRALATRIRPMLVDGVSGINIDGHYYMIERRDGDFVLVTVLPKGRINHFRREGRRFPG